MIHVILRHHCRIITRAEATIIDSREFHEASSSLVNIVQAVDMRVRKLSCEVHSSDCLSQCTHDKLISKQPTIISDSMKRPKWPDTREAL